MAPPSARQGRCRSWHTGSHGRPRAPGRFAGHRAALRASMLRNRRSGLSPPPDLRPNPTDRKRSQRALRPAALVPRPCAQLLTYHGVLAPAAQWRDRIVHGPRASTESDHGSTGPRAATSGRTAISSCPAISSSPETSSSPDSKAARSSPSRTRRLRWAERLRRGFAVDVLTCPDCGGARRLMATITDGLVIRRILGRPRAALLAADEYSRQSISRVRAHLVGRNEGELRLRASKVARSGGAHSTRLHAPPTAPRQLPRLHRAAARTEKGPDPLGRGIHADPESARTVTPSPGSSA